MTKYEVYEWLNRPTKLTYDIKAKIRLAEEIRSGLLPTAIRYDKDKIVTSYGTNADPMTEIMARVEAIQKEIAELQLQRAIAMIELEEVFSKLDKDERTVMSRHYLSRKKIEEIRIVDRAKLILIQVLKMTEPQAQHYIEKQSMDLRQTRLTTAESILRTYES